MDPFAPTALVLIKDALLPELRSLGHWAREYAASARAGGASLGITTKTSPGDMVTFADAEVQRRLVALLKPLIPGVGFLGEEELDDARVGEPTWVIDPIDGTHNFVRGYPGFAISVALIVAGRSLMGLIYDAVEDRVVWAIEGLGTWSEGVRWRRGDARPLEHALVASNFTSTSAASPLDQRLFADLSVRVAGVRSSGSACRDWVLLASGRTDLFWQIGLKPWDVAAGLVIVREAGGVLRFEDEPSDWMRGAELRTFAGEAALVEEAIGRYRALRAAAGG
jgi:myo-inositol-1(or 4)-monophosphatase